MEASKKFYTFGEALTKIQSDPENLAMTRLKYFNEGIYIRDVVPSIVSEGVVFPKRPSLVMFNNRSTEEAYWIPSQEDLHSNNWFILKKIKRATPENTESLNEDVSRKFLLTLKDAINALLEDEE